MSNLRLRVRYQGQETNICGIEVESIEQSAIVSPVPGSRFHMALVRGQILPVIKVGDCAGCLVVGRVGSEVVGVFGLDIIGFAPGGSVSDEASMLPRSDPANVLGSPASSAELKRDQDSSLDIAALIAGARQPSRIFSQTQENP